MSKKYLTTSTKVWLEILRDLPLNVSYHINELREIGIAKGLDPMFIVKHSPYSALLELQARGEFEMAGFRAGSRWTRIAEPPPPPAPMEETVRALQAELEALRTKFVNIEMVLGEALAQASDRK